MTTKPGMSIKHAAILATQELEEPVSEARIRVWISRGQVERTADGQVCVRTLMEWFRVRDPEQARRRSLGHAARRG